MNTETGTKLDEVCPGCGGPLTEVRSPAGSVFNRDQWESMIVGNWYCTACPPHPDRTAHTGYRYWWDSEVHPAPTTQGEGEDHSVKACGICGAVECQCLLNDKED